MSGTTCKEFCQKYKANRPKNSDRYGTGQKYCVPCKIFIKWEGKHCPCCNNNLRSKGRGKQNLAEKYKVRIE